MKNLVQNFVFGFRIKIGELKSQLNVMRPAKAVTGRNDRGKERFMFSRHQERDPLLAIDCLRFYRVDAFFRNAPDQTVLFQKSQSGIQGRQTDIVTAAKRSERRKPLTVLKLCQHLFQVGIDYLIFCIFVHQRSFSFFIYAEFL